MQRFWLGLVVSLLLPACATTTPRPEAAPARQEAPAEPSLAALMQEPPEEQLVYAQRRFDEGRYADAAALLEATTERRPDLADAQRLYGHALALLGRGAEARRALTQALTLGRLAPDVLWRLAELERTEGHPDSYENLLRLLTVVDSEQAQWHLLHAATLSGAGRFAEAERIYRHQVARAPADGTLWLYLGNLYLEQGQAAQAAAAYETAAHLGQSEPALYRTIGELWLQLGDERLAAAWHARAEANTAAQTEAPVEPPRGANPLRRAALLLAAGDVAGAQRAAEAVLQGADAETAAAAYVLLGRAALARNDRATALQHWHRAAQGGAVEDALLEYLAQDCFQRGDYGRAAAYLARGLEQGAADAELLQLHAQSLLRAGQAAEGARAVRRYVEQFGLNGPAQGLIVELARSADAGAAAVRVSGHGAPVHGAPVHTVPVHSAPATALRSSSR